MKVLNVALMAIALFMVATVGGCRKHHFTHDLTTVTLDPNTYTPQHLTVVDIDDPCHFLADGKVTQDRILKDLDYQILYVWYNKELGEEGHADFNSVGLQGYAHSVKFHLVVADRFELNGRFVRYAQIDDDIFLATGTCFGNSESVGRRLLRDADRSMDLFTNDTHDHDDNPDPTYLAPGTEPDYGSYLAPLPQ